MTSWTTPRTWVAGEVLTAALLNTHLRDNILTSGPIYSNEAARDAAITAPTEGMCCYLSASTVAAATGGTTAVPTGVQTVYNGSVWVCTTPVGAHETASGTTTSTSYTASLSGSPGTNPTVTLVTGTTALVTLYAGLYNSSAAGSRVSVAVSGAGTVAASNSYAIANALTSGLQYGVSFILTGLTAGTNTFTLQYKVDSGTGTFGDRDLTVRGVA